MKRLVLVMDELDENCVRSVSNASEKEHCRVVESMGLISACLVEGSVAPLNAALTKQAWQTCWHLRYDKRRQRHRREDMHKNQGFAPHEGIAWNGPRAWAAMSVFNLLPCCRRFGVADGRSLELPPANASCWPNPSLRDATSAIRAE